MEIQCECGKFRAELKQFPKNTPGRCVCYCDDCQAYLHHLGRADLLDANGGTEVIPTYPADFKILAGAEQLKCTRLSPNGVLRFSSSCCNTPLTNVRKDSPWSAVFHRAFSAKASGALEKAVGPVRSRVMGKFAKGTPPTGTPAKFDLKALLTVLPFLVKGYLGRKAAPSPFFKDDGETPVVKPNVLTKEERRAALHLAGF